jgi:hypothetical protein
VDCLAEGCRRESHVRRLGTGELLRPGSDGRGGIPPHAVLRRLWRACRGGVAGYGACDEHAGPATARGAARGGGKTVTGTVGR